MKKLFLLILLFACIRIQAQVQALNQSNEVEDYIAQSALSRNVVHNTYVYYAVNDAQIHPESIPALNLLLEVVAEFPQSYIHIEGWTDDSGDKNLDDKVSLKRAELIKQYLVNNNIEPNRISYKGMGCVDKGINIHKARCAEVKVLVPPERQVLIYP